jgi:hypothetical protein
VEGEPSRVRVAGPPATYAAGSAGNSTDRVHAELAQEPAPAALGYIDYYRSVISRKLEGPAEKSLGAVGDERDEVGGNHEPGPF